MSNASSRSTGGRTRAERLEARVTAEQKKLNRATKDRASARASLNDIVIADFQASPARCDLRAEIEPARPPLSSVLLDDMYQREIWPMIELANARPLGTSGHAALRARSPKFH